MNTTKKELAVAALRNGTVIDHIPSHALFRAVKFLGLENSSNAITIGNNLASPKLGKKGIIKISDTFFSDDILNRIAIIAPTAVVNIIKDFNVVEKKRVSLPDRLSNIVRCENPKCITNNEPMPTTFEVIERNEANDKIRLRCCYCNHTVDSDKVSFK